MSSHTIITKPRKPPTVRTIPEPPSESSEEESLAEPNTKVSVGIQVSDGSQQEIEELKDTIIQLKADLAASKFCIENVSKDDQLVTFYTGFQNYATLKPCYDYLGPAANNLMYWGSKENIEGHGRSRALTSLNEFFWC